MDSESTEEATVTVSLPVELDQWLDDRADELGVDRATVLVQLLASYRTATQYEDELADGQGFRVHQDVIEETVEAELTDRLDGQVRQHVTERLDDRVETEVARQLKAALDSVLAERVTEATDNLSERVDDLETDYSQSLDDVRERVVQLKREIDGKAPRDHGHEELDRVTDVADRLGAVEETVEDVESTVAEHDVVVDDIEQRLDEAHDRLKSVAWVVSDLRDAHESSGGLEAVERIKRAAAKADIDRAKCESCGDEVEIALLTDPECPHCEATVTNVEPSSGFFGSPRLVVASQLESGEN